MPFVRDEQSAHQGWHIMHGLHGLLSSSAWAVLPHRPSLKGRLVLPSTTFNKVRQCMGTGYHESMTP